MPPLPSIPALQVTCPRTAGAAILITSTTLIITECENPLLLPPLPSSHLTGVNLCAIIGGSGDQINIYFHPHVGGYCLLLISVFICFMLAFSPIVLLIGLLDLYASCASVCLVSVYFCPSVCLACLAANPSDTLINLPLSPFPSVNSLSSILSSSFTSLLFPHSSSAFPHSPHPFPAHSPYFQIFEDRARSLHGSRRRPLPFTRYFSSPRHPLSISPSPFPVSSPNSSSTPLPCPSFPSSLSFSHSTILTPPHHSCPLSLAPYFIDP